MVRRFTKYPQNITAAVTTMAPEVTIGELLNLVYETQKLLGNYNSSDDGWFKLREVYLDACDSGDTDKIVQLYDELRQMHDTVYHAIERLKQQTADIDAGNYRKPKK